MVSRDTANQMVDRIDDLSEVRQNPTKQATEPAPTTTRGVAGEITPEEDVKAAQYGSELGKKTLAQYYSTYLIPEGLVLMALFEAPGF